MMRRLGAGLAIALALAATVTRAETPAPAATPLPPVLDTTAIDRNADPCADFYQYACGAWSVANPIPEDRSLWWRNSVLDEHTLTILAEILQDAANNGSGQSETARKMGDYYASCLDEDAIEAKGLAPFMPELAALDALADKRELAAAIARLGRRGSEALFSFYTAQDYEDARMMMAAIDQGGFALPDRDYYLTEEFAGERADYRAHLVRMFELLGDDHERAETEADGVMRVETALAKTSMSLVERRQPNNVHHKMTLAAFRALMPSFDWTAYLSGVGAPSIEQIDVVDPGFFVGAEKALAEIPLDDWKAYLRWTYINDFASLAPRAIVAEDFAFFGKRLGGQPVIAARWKRCVGAADGQIGDAVGEAYVKRVFGPEAKARVLAMVHEIETAMAADIETLDWMSDATKARAREKLSKVANKIGYPDKWIDYSKLEVVRGDALGNAERASAFDLDRELAKIGKPVDRGEWSMSAPTNNAYYDAQMNDINFPAGVLQRPNFDLAGDDAANYGALSFLIGHELTHGFDDEGRHYDAYGNLNDWWTEADAKAFEARAAGLIEQYGAFVAVKDPSDPARDIHVDGALTLGENTADNGGIRLAYSALLANRPPLGKADSTGYTPEQRFFLGYAQSWCVNRTDAFAKEAAKTDPHAPGKFRVNGPLANMLEFRQAFSCKVGSPMAPATIRRVW